MWCSNHYLFIFIKYHPFYPFIDSPPFQKEWIIVTNNTKIILKKCYPFHSLDKDKIQTACFFNCAMHISLKIFSSSFFPPGNLFFITSSSCWGPSSWPSRHGNLLVGMQYYKLCGSLEGKKEEAWMIKFLFLSKFTEFRAQGTVSLCFGEYL